jgi:LacI family transcriptional regulator
MILGAQEAALSDGRLIVVMNTEGDPNLESQELTALLQHPVDGVLYATTFHRTVDLPLLLRDTPVVLVDAESADPTVSWVVPDEFAGAHAAVSELLAYGHRRIGFVTNKESNWSSSQLPRPPILGRAAGHRGDRGHPVGTDRLADRTVRYRRGTPAHQRRLPLRAAHP